MFFPNLNIFLPYQKRWITDAAPIAIGEKSRRIGWTFASSYRAVERRLALRTNLYHTSADLSAAREFIEYCQRWARAFNVTAHSMGNEIIDEQEDITALGIRFKETGAKIVAGSSNPKFFRSKGGDADADEFAFHQDPRELYKAMQPTALVWGHALRLWSTHNGEGSFFAKLIEKAKASNTSASALSTTPSLHTVSLLDAVEQGLVETIQKRSTPDLNARREFIESIRASCPDEDSWNEEYLCKPSSENTSLLGYGLIAGCEDTACDVAMSGHVQLPTARPLYAGFDVGRKHDRSVLWVLERVGDVFWTRELRVLESIDFTRQEQMLHALLGNRAIRRLCIDATGLGAMLAERLSQRWGHRAEAIQFSAPAKAELAMPLLRLFQDRLLRVPATDAVRNDLHKVRKIITTSHNVRLDAPRDADGHADRFWALALAYHASDDAKGRRHGLPSSAMKPFGW